MGWTHAEATIRRVTPGTFHSGCNWEELELFVPGERRSIVLESNWGNYRVGEEVIIDTALPTPHVAVRWHGGRKPIGVRHWLVA
jgi:hypothetical protein